MFAPASFDDAASRYLEETDLPARFRWDPRSRRWAALDAGTWTYVPTEAAVTHFARYLADEFELMEARRAPIPVVLSGVPKAPTWAHLRAKINRSAANAVARLASGSPAFIGLPRDTVDAPRPAPSDEPVAEWVRSAVVSSPGSFLLRSTVTAAFKEAHGHRAGIPSRQVVSRVAQDVLGATRKRAGQHGWPGVALAS